MPLFVSLASSASQLELGSPSSPVCPSPSSLSHHHSLAIVSIGILYKDSIVSYWLVGFESGICPLWPDRTRVMGRTNSVREMIICLVHLKASVIGHSAEADGGQVVC